MKGRRMASRRIIAEFGENGLGVLYHSGMTREELVDNLDRLADRANELEREKIELESRVNWAEGLLRLVRDPETRHIVLGD